MKLAYDFHLHSCLSPCGDDDMTPAYIVKAAKRLCLDVIALTDHNSAANCPAAVRAGEDVGLTVIPGMELCTAEEIHVICLFPDCDAAEEFSRYVRGRTSIIKNNPAVFGRQMILDERDNLLGEEELLLIAASGVGICELPRLIMEYGGFCYPAHIDRPSFSILSSLGTIDAGMGFNCAEVSLCGVPEKLAALYPALRGMRILRSSDAHRPEQLRGAAHYLDPPENTPRALITFLSQYGM